MWVHQLWEIRYVPSSICKLKYKSYEILVPISIYVLHLCWTQRDRLSLHCKLLFQASCQSSPEHLPLPVCLPRDPRVQTPTKSVMCMQQLRPRAVTWVCADNNSYLKIGPNYKKKGLSLSGSLSSIRPHNDVHFWDFGFHSKSARLVSAPGHQHRAWGASEARWWGIISLRRNDG